MTSGHPPAEPRPAVLFLCVHGIDIAGQVPQRWTDEIARAADVIEGRVRELLARPDVPARA
jgi:hypothetical protein